MSSQQKYSYAKSLDDFIILLACRYEADPNYDEREEEEGGDDAFFDAQERNWALVAEGVRHHISHPLTAEERANLRFIEASMFTPDMCRSRAQYALWCREQSKKKRAAKHNGVDGGAVSGFNIAKHSLRDEVTRLYAQVRASLPSCDDVELSDDDDDEEHGATAGATKPANPSANPFAKLKQFTVKSQEDVDRDVALAKAEEELLAQFAALQQEHFRKTRRWVDVPTELLKTQQSPATPADTATASASKRGTSPPAITAATYNLESFEKSVGVIRSNGKQAAYKPTHADPNDPIRVAKQALNPYSRPPRPSSQYEEEEEEDDYEAFLAENDDDVRDMLTSWKKPSSSSATAAAPRTTTSAAATTTSTSGNSASAANSAPTRATTATAPPPSAPASAGRGNRWNIVEYEDDDDEE